MKKKSKIKWWIFSTVQYRWMQQYAFAYHGKKELAKDFLRVFHEREVPEDALWTRYLEVRKELQKSQAKKTRSPRQRVVKDHPLPRTGFSLIQDGWLRNECESYDKVRQSYTSRAALTMAFNAHFKTKKSVSEIWERFCEVNGFGKTKKILQPGIKTHIYIVECFDGSKDKHFNQEVRAGSEEEAIKIIRNWQLFPTSIKLKAKKIEDKKPSLGWKSKEEFDDMSLPSLKETAEQLTRMTEEEKNQLQKILMGIKAVWTGAEELALYCKVQMPAHVQKYLKKSDEHADAMLKLIAESRPAAKTEDSFTPEELKFLEGATPGRHSIEDIVGCFRCLYDLNRKHSDEAIRQKYQSLHSTSSDAEKSFGIRNREAFNEYLARLKSSLSNTQFFNSFDEIINELHEFVVVVDGEVVWTGTQKPLVNTYSR